GGAPVADTAVHRRAQDGHLDLAGPEVLGCEADGDAQEGPDARVGGVELVAPEVDRSGLPPGVSGAVAPCLPRGSVPSGRLGPPPTNSGIGRATLPASGRGLPRPPRASAGSGRPLACAPRLQPCPPGWSHRLRIRPRVRWPSAGPSTVWRFAWDDGLSSGCSV